jgi:hypothetical protein
VRLSAAKRPNSIRRVLSVWRVNLGETGGGDLDGMRRPIAGS